MHSNQSQFTLSHIQEALNASGIGVWQFDVNSGTIELDTTAQKLFGYKDQTGYYKDVFTASEAESVAIAKALEKVLKTNRLQINYLPYNTNIPVTVKGGKNGPEGLFYGTVQPVLLKKNTIEYNTFETVINEAPVATCLFVGRELKIEVANKIMLEYWGRDESILGLPLEEAIPELKGQPFLDILDTVYTTGETYTETDALAELIVDGVLGVYYFDYTYKPLKNADGEIYAIMDMAVDVTERVLSKQKREQTDLRFRNVIEQSPIAIGFLQGSNMNIEIANDRMLKLWGKDNRVLGMPVEKALPELKGQGFIELLNEVYETGVTHRSEDALVKLDHNGVLTDVYVDFIYSALHNENNTTNGILVIAADVSERITALREIAASEEKFKSVIYAAQAAVAVFKGKDLVTDIANNAFLQFVGRTRDEFVGKPLAEAMPEINGQESIQLMQEVFEKGIKTHNFGRQIKIIKNGVLTTNYYNVSYTPLYNSNGEVYGVLDIAIDVTDTIKYQHALQKAEASLRGAIELAGLGTWSFDSEKGEIYFSERVREWYGFDAEEKIDAYEAFECVHPDDKARVINKTIFAINQKSNGLFEEEFTVINKKSGVERILHSQGRVYFNDDNKTYMLSGTTLDITSHKKIQIALENQVKERTEDLMLANKELENMNIRLLHSNEELAQYAYVASHDLQEPLRKISMFSNLLKERDKDKKHEVIIDKIVTSSQRMSLLIKDLLEFSRLLNTDIRFVKTNLNDIVKGVIGDFELLIEEKKAQIEISDLPDIDAIPLQMNQLFYNLIGNALKFISADKSPKVTVNCEIASQEQVKQYITKPENTIYYIISVIDNGIGIEEKYLKQIFDVFKRLHSRTEYSGSGIGLSICRRIVSNHKGQIFTDSRPGLGTTFHIILPAKQTRI
ncbi:PAS domain-containing protein [Flavobacterium rhizosphaerae]|uniref:histidine kinase n=1 Tax=Flavobacterium rhizosphaerae TaxID=3163298 RepID=A0ABW8YWN3_9FLAO